MKKQIYLKLKELLQVGLIPAFNYDGTLGEFIVDSYEECIDKENNELVRVICSYMYENKIRQKTLQLHSDILFLQPSEYMEKYGITKESIAELRGWNITETNQTI